MRVIHSQLYPPMKIYFESPPTPPQSAFYFWEFLVTVHPNPDTQIQWEVQDLGYLQIWDFSLSELMLSQDPGLYDENCREVSSLISQHSHDPLFTRQWFLSRQCPVGYSEYFKYQTSKRSWEGRVEGKEANYAQPGWVRLVGKYGL